MTTSANIVDLQISGVGPQTTSSTTSASAALLPALHTTSTTSRNEVRQYGSLVQKPQLNGKSSAPGQLSIDHVTNIWKCVTDGKTPEGDPKKPLSPLPILSIDEEPSWTKCPNAEQYNILICKLCSSWYVVSACSSHKPAAYLNHHSGQWHVWHNVSGQHKGIQDHLTGIE